MRSLVAAGVAFALVLLPSCAPRRPAPAPPPPQAPARPAPPQPAPPPLARQDAPASAGDWTWREDSGASTALFGSASAPAFMMRCVAGREVELVRPGAAGAAMTIRTTGAERRLAASAGADGLGARLAASDPLLDEIVFSRGRFAVEADGAPLLILPAWPETARVIEDCRG
jgi:hypothetical protein